MDNLARSRVLRDAREGPIFRLEDLAQMRHAYDMDCRERMTPESTKAQRTNLAKAVVSTYRSGLTENDFAHCRNDLGEAIRVFLSRRDAAA